MRGIEMKLNQSVDTKTIDDVKCMAGQNSENGEVDPWTWKDTLARIQYIDKIIEQIVSGAILLNSCLLAAFGALNIVFHSTGLLSEREIIVQWAITVVCIGGIATNVILAINLARQEYIRQWYFCIFPDKKLPLMPDKDWLERDIINTYCMDYPKQEVIIEKAYKRLFICKLGNKVPGYCELWFYILLFMAGVFLVFAVLSYFL